MIKGLKLRLPNIKIKPLTQPEEISAFSLAEILVTLAIIGFVAAMTIPTLIKSNNEKAYKVAWKKSYELVVGAYNRTKSENGSVAYIGTGWHGFDKDTVNTMLSYMNVVKTCLPTVNNTVSNGFDDPNCTASDTWAKTNIGAYRTLSGKTFGFQNMTRKVALLQDGTVLYIGGDFRPIWGIDVNGANKKPNIIGKDTFGIEFTTTWSRPIGANATQGYNNAVYGASGCGVGPYSWDVNSLLYLPRAAGIGCSAAYILND